MPDGFQVYKQAAEYANAIRQQFQMLDTVTATDTGVWIDSSELKTFSLDVTGNGAGFSLVLMGSNAPYIPSNATDGNTISAAITANGITQITATARWMKVKLTTIASGTVSANLFGTNQ